MTLHHTAARSGKLLTFLRTELALSSTLVKTLKWKNAFLVNGAAVHTNHPVVPGDRITVLLEEDRPEFPPEEGPLTILYEDDSLLAIDKPAGLLMHPSFYRNRGTLANFVAAYYQRTNQACAVHPVSRLDRDTFGLVLLAKNGHIHARMMELLKTRQVEKTYHALVEGRMAEASGIWDFPIARRGGGSLLREVRPDGQEALTEWKTLEVYEAAAKLELHPITGRTHQLRVHCAHAGHPIVGDPQYGHVSPDYPHQQLCAVRLAFPHPLTGQPMEIESKLAEQIAPPPAPPYTP